MNDLDAIDGKPALQILVIVSPFLAISGPIRIENDAVIAEADRRRSGRDHDDSRLRATGEFDEAPYNRLRCTTSIDDESAVGGPG